MRDLREGGPRLRSAGVARAPTWSSFPASGSCLASAFIRRLITTCSALVLCPSMVPSERPPFPAPSAFGAAAIPRSVMAAIPRGSADAGRHPAMAPAERQEPPAIHSAAALGLLPRPARAQLVAGGQRPRRVEVDVAESHRQHRNSAGFAMTVSEDDRTQSYMPVAGPSASRLHCPY